MSVGGATAQCLVSGVHLASKEVGQSCGQSTKIMELAKETYRSIYCDE